MGSCHIMSTYVALSLHMSLQVAGLEFFRTVTSGFADVSWPALMDCGQFTDIQRSSFTLRIFVRAGTRVRWDSEDLPMFDSSGSSNRLYAPRKAATRLRQFLNFWRCWSNLAASCQSMRSAVRKRLRNRSQRAALTTFWRSNRTDRSCMELSRPCSRWRNRTNLPMLPTTSPRR